ncbi:MAG: DUF1697 domain-containing protein [Candidatus Sulfotelmatobacter sp.]
MPVYIAMLRGINVGGHKRIKMEQLRASFEALGFEQVRTYIQSGNVVFKAPKISPSALSKRIEERILKDFGFQASVVSRTVEEMARIIANNPFLKDRGIDQEKLHVTFLSEAPAPAALSKLAGLTAAPDQCSCLGKDVYLYLPNGTTESSLMKASFDRVLSVVATTRNWRTVNTIHQMCQECR